MFTHGQTLTILRPSPGGDDAYGDPVASTTERIDVAGCALDALYSSETTDRGRAGIVVGYTVLGPAGMDIRSTDTVEIAGQIYRVEGIAFAPVNPFTGWTPGVEFAIKRAAG